MATQQHYVNTASAGGDGTTNNTSGATAAFASLASWEANVGGSNNATDDYIVDCCGTAADTSSVTVDFATNLTTGSITVRGNRSDAAGFYEGSAVISSSHYRLSPGNVASALAWNEAGHGIVDGIQVISGHTGSFGLAIGPAPLTVASFTAKNNRLHTTTGAYFGIGRSSGFLRSNPLNYENNLAVGFSRDSFQVWIGTHFNPVVNVLHNTAYGNGSATAVGVRIQQANGSATPTINVKGNVAANCNVDIDTASYLEDGGTLTLADNATEDSTGQITSIVPADVWTSPGTTAASDFTVKDTASALYNAVNPTLVSTDITGFTRDGTNHDVGAFEFQAGGGSNTTITAGQGGYTLSGQAVTTRYGRKIVAAQGTYNLAGQAVLFRQGRLLTAASGSYNLSGQDVDLTTLSVLQAAHGLYNLLGQSVGLSYGRKIPLAQGSYTLTGQAVVFVIGFRLAAAHGLYNLTGQAATLTGSSAGETEAYAHTIPANTLSVNGQTIEFLSAGTFAASLSTDKRIRAKFGGETIFDSGNLAIVSAATWHLKGVIMRTGAASQKNVVSLLTSDGAIPLITNYNVSGVDLTSDAELKLTIAGSNADDVVAEMYKDRWVREA